MSTTVQIKERPILMHARSINGILEGRKTQTRRIMKPQPWLNTVNQWLWDHKGRWQHAFHPGIAGNDATTRLRSYCPYGQPGDRLWVREAWHTGRRLDEFNATEIAAKAVDAGYSPGAPLWYSDGAIVPFGDADEDDFGFKGRYRHGRFMPRWASRLTLEIANIRVERVQEISANDCLAEGIDYSKHRCGCDFCATAPQICPASSSSLIMEFASLWDDTNGKGAWERNDWVWAIDFRSLVA